MRHWLALFGLLLPLVGWGSGGCPHAGPLLVATPAMWDAHFRVSVVLLVGRDAERPTGFVVNRLGAVRPLGEVGEGCELPAGVDLERMVAIHYGGPLLNRSLWAVHGDDFEGESSCSLGEGLWLSDGCELLRAVARGRGPARYLMLRGMAAWRAGQLEEELAQEWWRRLPLDRSLVLELPDVVKWHRARALAGVPSN